MAAERFDPDKGIQFSTFAGSYILGYLKQHYEHFECSVLKVPRHIVFGDGSTSLPVCDSLETPVGNDNLTLEDVIADSEDTIGDMIENIGFAAEIKVKLTAQEQRIIKLLYAGMTQTQAGKAIGINQTLVCRRVKKIKKKLKGE